MDYRVRPVSRKILDPLPPSTLAQMDPNTAIKTLAARLEHMEGVIVTQQQQIKVDRDLIANNDSSLTRRVDKVEYQVFGIMKDLEQMTQLRSLAGVGSQSNNSGYRPLESSSNNNQPSSDSSLLKQMILQDRQSLRDQSRHQAVQVQQLSLRQIKLEQQMRAIINKQAEELNEKLSSHSDQLRSADVQKSRKMEQQYDQVKGVIAAAEKRIYEDLDKKIRNDTLVKDFIETKLQNLKEEIIQQHKLLIATETKFVRETKQSLQTMFSLLQTTKAELAAQLAETQQLSASNFKRLATSIDLVREMVGDQMAGIGEAMSQHENNVEQLRSEVAFRIEQQRQDTIAFQQTAIKTSEQAESRFRQPSEGVASQQIQSLYKEINQWKASLEQKNITVFKEISNSLKALKTQFQRDVETLTTDTNQMAEAQQVLKKSIPAQIKKAIYTMVEVFNSQYDSLGEEIQMMGQMIAASKKELEQRNKEEQTKLREAFTAQMLSQLDSRAKQYSLSLERNSNKLEDSCRAAIKKESKYVTDLLTQKHTSLETELQKVNAAARKTHVNTTSQLDDFTTKLRDFNENYSFHLEQQRKDDLKKRLQLEETMRKNASSLMETAYKKSEFLVEGMKKALEMSIERDKMEVLHANAKNRDDLMLGLDKLRTELTSTMTEKLNSFQDQSEDLSNKVDKRIAAIEESTRSMNKGIERRMEELEKSQSETESSLQQSITETKTDLNSTMESWRQQSEESLRSSVNQTADDLNKKISLVEKQLQEGQSKLQQDMNEHVEMTVSTIRKSMEIQLSNTKLEMSEKISELQTQLANNKNAQQEQAIKELKQSVLKLETRSFTQTARYKAVQDQMSQDIAKLADNVGKLSMK